MPFGQAFVAEQPPLMADARMQTPVEPDAVVLVVLLLLLVVLDELVLLDVVDVDVVDVVLLDVVDVVEVDDVVAPHTGKPVIATLLH